MRALYDRSPIRKRARPQIWMIRSSLGRDVRLVAAGRFARQLLFQRRRARSLGAGLGESLLELRVALDREVAGLARIGRHRDREVGRSRERGERAFLESERGAAHDLEELAGGSPQPV